MAQKEKWTILDAPFEARSLLKNAGAEWIESAKVWGFKGEMPDWARGWASKPYSMERMIEDRLNGENGKASKGGEITLREHQAIGASLIEMARKAGLPGFLLADEVGLGKTHTAWEAAKKEGGDVLIVAPLSVVPHWRRAIERHGDGGARVLVMNYDRMQRLFDVPEGSKAKSLKGKARAGEPPSFRTIIFDEAHKMKNHTAARSKLGAKLASRADFCIWMSATAGQTPLELVYAAPLLAARTGERVSALTKDFEEWCKRKGLGVSKGDFGRWQWDGTTESLNKTRDMLFGAWGTTCALRRTPQDVAGWPPIQRVVMPTSLNEKERIAYEKAWEDFRREWGRDGEKFEKEARKRGLAKSKATAALVATLRFRQKASLIRAEKTIEFAEDLLEQGMQTAISCAFLETTDVIERGLAKYGVARITGRESAEEREKNRLDFQRGKKRVVVFTVEEGISLHEGEEQGGDARRALLLHDLRWSAIQAAQIEGRCHRDGKAALAYWMMAEDTIEERLGRRLAERMAGAKTLSGDDSEEAEALGRELIAAIEGKNS